MVVRFTPMYLFSCLLLGTVLGCGNNSNLAPVEGTVTMDGKPLQAASIIFINGQSSPSGARTDEKGFYKLSYSDTEDGAVPGKNIVRISTAQGSNITEEGKPVPARTETVPTKYHVHSTLEFTVEPGKKTVADWKLDSKGPILPTE